MAVSHTGRSDHIKPRFSYDHKRGRCVCDFSCLLQGISSKVESTHVALALQEEQQRTLGPSVHTERWRERVEGRERLRDRETDRDRQTEGEGKRR